MTERKHRLYEFDERELVVGGARLVYAVGGAGPPIVLVHGLGGTIETGVRSPRARAESSRSRRRSAGARRLGAAARRGPRPRSVRRRGRRDARGGGDRRRRLGSGTRSAASWRSAPRCDARSWCAESSSRAPRVRAPRSRAARVTLTIDGMIRPGRMIAPHGERWARSARGRRVAFWWGVGDTRALEPEAAEASSPARRAIRPRCRPGARWSPPIRAATFRA